MLNYSHHSLRRKFRIQRKEIFLTPCKQNKGEHLQVPLNFTVCDRIRITDINISVNKLNEHIKNNLKEKKYRYKITGNNNIFKSYHELVKSFIKVTVYLKNKCSAK